MMLSVKLALIIILGGALITARISQLRPALAISIEKQQLLDKIFAEEEDARNETSIATSETIDNIKNNAKEKRDKILGETGITLTANEQKQVEQEDSKILSVHTSKLDGNCRTGDVLAGASNKKDLKILSKCEEVIGTVKHTKKMNDGDYKFALKVRDQFKDLLNKINKKKTGGYLIVEIVPKDQNNKNVIKPKTGDKVDVWGAWVTDKPKGWHEIHPAWIVQKIK